MQTIIQLTISQKFLIVVLFLVALLVMHFIGMDPYGQEVQYVFYAFAALFGGQALLDLRWGSPSDRTGAFDGGKKPLVSPKK